MNLVSLLVNFRLCNSNLGNVVEVILQGNELIMPRLQESLFKAYHAPFRDGPSRN